MHLANTAAIIQYEGLKYGDDDSDARWLAKLLRLGLLPEGYIYPREERPVRDLVRKRSQLVHQHTSNLHSVQNLMARNRGHSLSANQIKRLSNEEVDRLLPDADLALAVKSNLAVMRTLDGVISCIEKAVLQKVKLRAEFEPLLSVNGIGNILSLTIMLETGEIGRFAKVGNYAPIAAVWAASTSATVSARGAETPRTGTSIWPGPTLKLQTLQCATALRSNATTSVSVLAPIASLP